MESIDQVEDLLDESSHDVEEAMETVMSCSVCLVPPSTSTILFRLVLKQVGYLTAWSKLLMPRRVRVSTAKNPESVASYSSLVITVVVAKMVVFSLNFLFILVMAFKSRKEAEAEVRGWGFNHVFTWTDGP